MYKEILRHGSCVIVGLLLSILTEKLNESSDRPTPMISRSLTSCFKMKLGKISPMATFGSRLSRDLPAVISRAYSGCPAVSASC